MMNKKLTEMLKLAEDLTKEQEELLVSNKSKIDSLEDDKMKEKLKTIYDSFERARAGGNINDISNEILNLKNIIHAD